MGPLINPILVGAVRQKAEHEGRASEVKLRFARSMFRTEVSSQSGPTNAKGTRQADKKDNLTNKQAEQEQITEAQQHKATRNNLVKS